MFVKRYGSGYPVFMGIDWAYNVSLVMRFPADKGIHPLLPCDKIGKFRNILTIDFLLKINILLI